MADTVTWEPDVLGDGYVATTFELGKDPDGQGDVSAVLVRRNQREGEEAKGAVLYVHGFSDYFSQTELADFFAERGLAFYGLDLRKCGRARKAGQTPHYASDLTQYDAELDASLSVIEAEHPGRKVLVVGHSTGGLIAPLWVDRRRKAGTAGSIAGLVLNSPWFDLQGRPAMRGPITQALRGISKVTPLRELPVPDTVYGRSLHVSGYGEWEFDVDLKPLTGFPVTIGWLNAIRRAQARFHRGIDVGVPSLVLRSDKTHYSRKYTDRTDRADTVLDVRQIGRWSGCLGGEITVVPVPDARHDVFLSLPEPRKVAYDVVDKWLRDHDNLF